MNFLTTLYETVQSLTVHTVGPVKINLITETISTGFTWTF